MGIFKRIRELELGQADVKRQLDIHARDHSWEHHSKDQRERMESLEKMVRKMFDAQQKDLAERAEKKDPKGGGGPGDGRYL